jgi:hypothetical protein
LDTSNIIIDLQNDSRFVLSQTVDLSSLGPLDEWIEAEKLVNYSGRGTPSHIIDNTRKAVARNWPTYKAGEFAGETLVLCGHAPSIGKPEQLKTIRRLTKKGAKVMAANRCHDFLLTKGIDVWAGILLDPIPHVANYIKPRKGVRYYIGSQCDPATFDAFDKPGIEKYIYHALAHDEQLEIIPKELHGMVLPKYGNTVILRAMWLGLAMGFREFHFFGFDSCYENEQSTELHASPKPETIHDKKRVKIPFPLCEQIYYSNGAMIAQAECFEQMVRMIAMDIFMGRLPQFTIQVHGEGMIPDIASAYGLHAKPERNYRYGKC